MLMNMILSFILRNISWMGEVSMVNVCGESEFLEKRKFGVEIDNVCVKNVEVDEVFFFVKKKKVSYCDVVGELFKDWWNSCCYRLSIWSFYFMCVMYI